MKKENYNEPIYENLELYSGLELVYRHPCLHFRVDSHECSNCKYGKINKCRIDEEYQKISKDLKDYEELKNLMGAPVQNIMKRLKILDILKNIIVVVPNTIDTAGPKYYIKLRPDVILNDETKEILKEWLENANYF